MRRLKTSSTSYTPAHVRLALEAGDIKGARAIAQVLGYNEKELEAAGLKSERTEGETTSVSPAL